MPLRHRAARVLAIAVVVTSTATVMAATGGGPAAAAATTGVRYAGGDRYATAAALSQSAFDPGVATVYIASGLGFADALAGAPAAAHHASPLLLTATDEIPGPTASELERLAPARIVVLGGDKAVSDDVVAALADFTTGTVDRLSGSNRAATAAAIALDTWPEGADTVLVANGTGFADALSGGAAGAQLDAPILLVDDAGVPNVTATTLDVLSPTRIQVLGGTSAVSVTTKTALGTHADSIGRWAGNNRYETSAAIANGAFGHIDTTMLAVGTQYTDALAATAVAATLGAPVLLSTSDCLPDAVATIVADMDITNLVVAGGTAVLSDDVVAGVPCNAAPVPLHFTALYLYPSDTTPQDRDQAIRDTLDEMNTWLDAETGGRRIRLTRTDGVIDVTPLALPFTAAELDPDSPDFAERWPDIYRWLRDDLGYISPRQQVAAFVESPGTSCGRGGFGLALLWLASCNSDFGVDDPREVLSAFAGIMIHEMLHTFGAVPSCAPNLDTSEAAPSHIAVATDRDIMFAVYNPRLDVALDPGRDDYYAHGRLDCADVVRVRYWERVADGAGTTTTTTTTSTTTTTP